jgi:hypothetical protein
VAAVIVVVAAVLAMMIVVAAIVSSCRKSAKATDECGYSENAIQLYILTSLTAVAL